MARGGQSACLADASSDGPWRHSGSMDARSPSSQEVEVEDQQSHQSGVQETTHSPTGGRRREGEGHTQQNGAQQTT